MIVRLQLRRNFLRQWLGGKIGLEALQRNVRSKKKDCHSNCRYPSSVPVLFPDSKDQRSNWPQQQCNRSQNCRKTKRGKRFTTKVEHVRHGERVISQVMFRQYRADIWNECQIA